MSISIDEILDAVVSHAQRLGVFEKVNQHEPKNAPGNGLSAAVWVDRIEPTRGSGLDSTTIKITFTMRLFTNMIQEPQDMIDPQMVKAVDLLLASFSDDFTLDGLIKNVDLLGSTGPGLLAQAGYVRIGSTLFRIMDITVPCMVNDVWEQGA